jgi:hypothetical protein
LSENVDYEKFLQVLRNILSATNHVDVAQIGNGASFPKGRPFFCGAKKHGARRIFAAYRIFVQFFVLFLYYLCFNL